LASYLMKIASILPPFCTSFLFLLTKLLILLSIIEPLIVIFTFGECVI
jgi:hypothetical protein